MRKYVFLIWTVYVCTVLCSCVKQDRLIEYDTSSSDVDTIYIFKGEKVVSIGESHGTLYFLTEEMDSDYIPKNKTVYSLYSDGFGHRHLNKSCILVESKN